MNPHFLYNMLESMNAVAMKHRVMELSDLISAPGALLRYTIYNQIGSATLRDELLFVEAYAIFLWTYSTPFIARMKSYYTKERLCYI